MNTEQTRLKQIVENSISAFNVNEEYLLRNDLSERCICARFAFYLQNEILGVDNRYQQYVVDVEYNRGAKGKDYEPKRLHNDDKPITVDLVVHQRGYREQACQHGDRIIIGYRNLICIEMKKILNRSGMRAIESDKNRLRIMTNSNEGFGYTVGFMIIIHPDRLTIDETFCFVENY
jgi:hypothetical protein